MANTVEQVRRDDITAALNAFGESYPDQANLLRATIDAYHIFFDCWELRDLMMKLSCEFKSRAGESHEVAIRFEKMASSQGQE